MSAVCNIHNVLAIMKIPFYLMIIAMLWAHTIHGQGGKPLVATSNGKLEGSIGPDGVCSFKGIPFAQPPVGDLRFREPQPPLNWAGTRKADTFGPRAMQLPVFSDMNFRSNGMSEDCLYLNVWTPTTTPKEKLPVLVYFYGGGFVGGDGSEFRYDGESMASKGIVAVTVNYRLGIFGFLSHPDLTKESAHHSSGNYGLLDQHAALVWVQKNIAAFGGDPSRVTIGGESAGSIAVCGQMASPLSKGLFAGAIGESGGMMGNIEPNTLADGEQIGAAFASGLGNKSLANLRAMPAAELLAATAKGAHFPTVVDGYFLPASPAAIFSAGEQMAVPLLVGWNSAEANYTELLGKKEPTVENYEKAIRKIYGDKADTILTLYKASSEDAVEHAASDLASDRFIAYSTWKWADLHTKTGGHPVYRYLYAHPRPPMGGDTQPGKMPVMGAGHSWEIEYALGNLHSNKVYAWTTADDKVSETMETYFANFIKTGNPNGAGLPSWKAMQTGSPEVMVIDVTPHLEMEKHPERYTFLDSLY